jgi:hypothetical protein
VHTSQIFQAWGNIVTGEHPSLSIEITRECPLKCPGCYAYDDAHLDFMAYSPTHTLQWTADSCADFR